MNCGYCGGRFDDHDGCGRRLTAVRTQPDSLTAELYGRGFVHRHNAQYRHDVVRRDTGEVLFTGCAWEVWEWLGGLACSAS